MAGEATPLLGTTTTSSTSDETLQKKVWLFLEAKTPRGKIYERFMIVLILLNVASYILGSLFVEPYNESLGYAWALRGTDESICGNLCDALWFGNYADNGLGGLGFGTTSVLELVTIAVFTIEYFLRIWTSPLLGYSNPLKFIVLDFFSWVDLASTLPFYLEAFGFSSGDVIGATGFLRMFRLFRMMKREAHNQNRCITVKHLLG